MPKDIQINIRLESRLRDEAEKVLGKLGVSLGEAVKIFLSQEGSYFHTDVQRMKKRGKSLSLI